MGTISLQIPASGQPNATEDPKISSDLTTLQTLLNGNIDSSNLSSSAGIVLSQLATAVQGLMFTPGDLKASAAAAPSTGWLLCDGAAVSRITFAALFAVCSTTFGAGDGSTTFNVPDLRGRTIVGAGAGTSLTVRAIGQLGGEESVTLTAAQSGAPGGSVSIQASAGAGNGGPNSIPTSTAAATSAPTSLASFGAQNASAAHDNMQPFGVLSWMVKT